MFKKLKEFWRNKKEELTKGKEILEQMLKEDERKENELRQEKEKEKLERIRQSKPIQEQKGGFQDIHIYPGSIEEYSRIYGPVEEIPLECSNKGVILEIIEEYTVKKSEKHYALLWDEKEICPFEFSEIGLVAIVHASMAKGVPKTYIIGADYTYYYGLPVRKKDFGENENGKNRRNKK